MPRNGSGVYTAPQNSWNPAVNGAQALPADWMAILQDLVAAMTQSTSADGQTLITGVWNFGNNRITGVGAPVGTGNALRWEQMTKGADIASDATIDIPIEGSLFDVTGTTTISTINDTFPGRAAFLRFSDKVTIENSASLRTPTGEDETTVDGDILCVVNSEPGVWEIASWPSLVNVLFPFRGVQVYSTAGSHTWDVPEQCKKALAIVVGGGGGGGGINSAANSSGGGAGGGGGGGGAVKLVDLTGETSVSITVGDGGAGGQLSNGWNGLAGATSSFGSFCSATGGNGGGGNGTVPASSEVYSGAQGGEGVGGDLNAYGSPGHDGTLIRPVSGTSCNGGNGGAAALLGGGADAGAGTSAGQPGRGPGSGGSGGAATNAAVSGGKGAPGIVVIIW